MSKNQELCTKYSEILMIKLVYIDRQQQQFIMSNLTIMTRELQKNQNSTILKQAITKVAKSVQQRVYWLNTSQMEGDFLQQYWDKQVTVNDVMKKRIAKITQQKFDQLFAEIGKGKVTQSHQLEVFHIGSLNLSAMAEQIPIFDHNYFSQNHPKTLQTKTKIKQIQSDYMRFKQKVEQIKQKQLEKKRQKATIEEQMRKSAQKEKKEKYREQVIKILEEKKQKNQQRKIQNEKYKQFLRAYRGSKPLHALMQQQYKQKFELPLIQQNKRKLEQYKQKVKPTLEEINEHEHNYLQSKAGRQSRIFVANQTIDVSFKSKFYLEEQEKMRENGQGYETLFDQMEKKKRYSELVKQNFKPKISTKLRESINQSQLKNSTARASLDRTAINQTGRKYLQFVRSLEKNRRQHSSPSQRAEQEPPHRYTNYLQVLKQSRQIQGNDSKLMSQDWQRDAKNKSLSEYQRRERILMKSRQLEEKAHRKQQFVNNNMYGKAEQIIQRKKQIDQTLISSIRAKVAVLKDAHEL